MATQIGKKKTSDQIAHGGRAPITHMVVRADGKIVGLHKSEVDAKNHAKTLNADGENYSVRSA